LWKGENATFVQNLSGHNTILNALAVNDDGVLVSGGDNGSLHFWDWMTGYNFQRLQAPVQPGSMENEAAIYAACFDRSGSRLITTEADKTIKIFQEDETATEESHPINWKPDILKRRRF
jgi:pleiotropic regulator 1